MSLLVYGTGVPAAGVAPSGGSVTAMQNGLLKISNFNGIPQSFVVDRDGNLRGVFRGGGKAEVKKMEELVAKVVAE